MHRVGRLIFRIFSRISALFALLLLEQSVLRPGHELIEAHPLTIKAERFDPQGLLTGPPFFLRGAWKLSSRDQSFGGLSALARFNDGFLAISDNGLRLVFSWPPVGEAVSGKIGMIPAGCEIDARKFTRDTEALALDTAGRTAWISFENRNKICRIDLKHNRALAITRPKAMRYWPATGGLETLVRLDDGRFLGIAERPYGDGPVSPVFITDRAPDAPGAMLRRMRYIPPAEFRPTDAVQLPDGNLLILNRTFNLPFSMPGRLVLVQKAALDLPYPISGKEVARIEGPDLDDNFEGLAVSQADGRTYIWLVSDDNFMPVQQTKMMLLEYRPEVRPQP